MAEVRVAFLLIGNELLSGKVKDLNSNLVIDDMRRTGGSLALVSIVGDDVDEIAWHVRTAGQRYDFVVTSGGVGPTHDDVTLEGVARAFGVELRTDPRLLAMIEEWAASKGREPNAWVLRMARVPTNAELHFEPAFPIPLLQVGNVFCLPGEPSLFRRKWEVLRERFRSAPVFVARAFFSVDEDELAATLARVQATHAVAVGSYPVYQNPDYRVMVTLESRDASVVDAASESLLAALPKKALVRYEGPREPD